MAGGHADRSRSARGRGGGASRGGWAPLRAGAPGRLPRSVGSYPDLSTEAARDAALAAADSDIYAASCGPPVASRIRFIHRALAEWGWTAWPPSYEKIRALGAVLMAGGYRSAAHYLSQYKVSGERRGRRSAARGECSPVGHDRCRRRCLRRRADQCQRRRLVAVAVAMVAATALQ